MLPITRGAATIDKSWAKKLEEMHRAAQRLLVKEEKRLRREKQSYVEQRREEQRRVEQLSGGKP